MAKYNTIQLYKRDIINMIKGGVDPISSDLERGFYQPNRGWVEGRLMDHSFGFLVKFYKKRRRD